MAETIEKSRVYIDAVIKRIDREMPVELKRFEAGIARTVMKARGESLDKLGELYRCIDKVFDFFGKYTPCKKGCSHCCYYKIDVSELEVAYVEKHSGVMRKPQGDVILGTHGMPCPFLRGTECSIYTCRPYACRKHVTVDATNFWCHPSRCNDAYLMMLQSSECKAAYEMLVDTGELCDIRNFFPIGATTVGGCGSVGLTPIHGSIDMFAESD
jgi:Fe-S-cluster containining protein